MVRRRVLHPGQSQQAGIATATKVNLRSQGGPFRPASSREAPWKGHLHSLQRVSRPRPCSGGTGRAVAAGPNMKTFVSRHIRVLVINEPASGSAKAREVVVWVVHPAAAPFAALGTDSERNYAAWVRARL